MKPITEITLNQYENALIFAVQKFSVSSTIDNAEKLIEAAKLVQQSSTSITEIKKAASFFKDGNFINGERCTMAGKLVKEIQRFISKSMQWLESTLDYYIVELR